MTDHIVRALDELGRLAGHLDTSDPQPLETIGRLNIPNIVLGLRHAWRLHTLMKGSAPITVLLPISQGRWGFLRDTALVLVIRVHGGRFVLHLHGGALDQFYARSGPVMRRIIRSVFRGADAAWALTPRLERMFDGLVVPTRVTHVENVTPPPQMAETTSVCDRSNCSFRVLYLANLFPQKGVFDLLDALALLGRDAHDWSVRLVGAGSRDIVGSLEVQAAALSADGGANIELLPAQYHYAKWCEYGAASVFVFPPRAPEGQPLVLLEAMACGVPIVTTDVGGIPDTVHDGVEGLVVTPGDIHGLAAALLRLSRDSALRAELGAHARAAYERNYRLERLTRDLARMTSGEDRSRLAELVPRGSAPIINQ